MPVDNAATRDSFGGIQGTVRRGGGRTFGFSAGAKSGRSAKAVRPAQLSSPDPITPFVDDDHAAGGSDFVLLLLGGGAGDLAPFPDDCFRETNFLAGRH